MHGRHSYAAVSRGSLARKRCLDLLIALALVPFVFPALLLITIAIRLEGPGPIIFRQRRTGRCGRPFDMFKFRTMVRNAEELKASLGHLNILPPPDFKIPDDPRITRVGKFLRKTSLDELPQLMNVLKGDMSWVGPRPTSFSADTYETWHARRLEVPPGVTGLWQVRMRNASTFDQRVRLDDEYIRSMSLRQDLKILCMTAGAVFKRTGN
jgi:lipopolysaccharide/colanic/teichoic acid biosynthesis glycosyltransferase